MGSSKVKSEKVSVFGLTWVNRAAVSWEGKHHENEFEGENQVLYSDHYKAESLFCIFVEMLNMWMNIQRVVISEGVTLGVIDIRWYLKTAGYMTSSRDSMQRGCEVAQERELHQHLEAEE